jgi:hypothetical protein
MGRADGRVSILLITNEMGPIAFEVDQRAITRIVCPNCGHAGATAASLPRVLICSKCRHGALIRSGKQARSQITQEQDAERAGIVGQN